MLISYVLNAFKPYNNIGYMSDLDFSIPAHHLDTLAIRKPILQPCSVEDPEFL